MNLESSRRPRRARQALLLAVAWLGGAAFVGSLLYFLYFYAVRLAPAPLAHPAGTPDATAPTSAATAMVANLLLFTVFALHHSAMARTGVKRWVARRLSPAIERSLYVWVASGLFALLCWAWRDLPGEVYRVEGWARWPLMLAQAGGAILAVRAARGIDVLELAGIRQVQRAVAGRVDSPEGDRRARLETAGPYRLVRHPIYLGWALLVLATPAMTVNRLAFALMSLAYLAVAIPLEERALRREFGQAYDTYRRRVRWRVIPGVY
jgi:protein-S-isoprenylcysteine O-methyltransferase Ste14